MYDLCAIEVPPFETNGTFGGIGPIERVTSFERFPPKVTVPEDDRYQADRLPCTAVEISSNRRDDSRPNTTGRMPECG